MFCKRKTWKWSNTFPREYNDFVFELYLNNKERSQDNNRLGFSVSEIEKIIKNLVISSSYRFNGRTIYVVTDPDGRKVELSE